MRNVTKLCFLFLLLLAPSAGLAQGYNGLVAGNSVMVAGAPATQSNDRKFKISVTGSVFGVPSNPNSAGDSIGLGIGATFQYARYKFSADVFGDHNDAQGNAPTRARYDATVHVYNVKDWALDAGAGAAKTGNEAYGYAKVVAAYEDDADFSIKFGAKNFTEAIARYRIFGTEHFAVHPFYSFTGEQINVVRIRTHRAGLQFMIAR